jgi:peptide/nickel transport system substrate-binding protein
LGYNNLRITQLVNEADLSATTGQTQKLREVNRIITEEAASVWLCLFLQIVIASSDLSGYPVNGLNSPL